MLTTTTLKVAGLFLASIHQVCAQIPSEFSAGFQFATSQLVVSYPQTGTFSNGQTLSVTGVTNQPAYSLGRSQNIGASSKFIVVMVSLEINRLCFLSLVHAVKVVMHCQNDEQYLDF